MILLHRCDFCGDLAVDFEDTPLGERIHVCERHAHT